MTYNIKHNTAELAFSILEDQLASAMKNLMGGQIGIITFERPDSLTLTLRHRAPGAKRPNFYSFRMTDHGEAQPKGRNLAR